MLANAKWQEICRFVFIAFRSQQMKTLSESTFRTLAGDRAYERGRAYYNEGRVGPLTTRNSRITAQVAGTYEYNVVLHHTAKIFEGHCTCPASDNFDFCKHCVAVALSYYYQTQTNQELADAPSTNRVLDYLNTLTKPQLAEELHKLLLKDSALMDLWQLKSEIASGGLDAKEVRKRITKAIPYKPSGLWRYQDVAMYFNDCEQALSVLDEPVRSLAPKDAIKITIYAAQRLEKTLHTIDDSGGYRFTVEEQIRSWFVQTFLSEEWGNKQKSETLVNLLTDQEFDYDVLAPLSVSENLDEETLKKVYTALDKVWEDLTPQIDHYSDQYYYYHRIEHLILKRARQLNDLEKEFLILEKGAVTIPKCLELVGLCTEHRKFDEANLWISHAEEMTASGAHQLYDIESAQIKLWKAEGQTQKAFDAQWARFEEQEDTRTLNSALATAEQMKQRKVWLNKAIAYIDAKLTPDRSNHKNRHRAETLVEIHLASQDLKSAYQLSDRYLMRVDLLMAIVDATKTFTEKTFTLIERISNHIVRIASNSAYDNAVTFLQQQEARLDGTDKDRFYKTVLSIYNEPQNKRKTNFVKRLKTAFPLLF